MACAADGPRLPTLARVEILFWLLPPVVVTVVAMAWVGWLGREGRGEVDRDVAVRRLAEALQREDRGRPGRPLRRPGPPPATAAPASPSAPRAPRACLDPVAPLR